ncbi:hypothetical protein [Azospirillum himalayense]|uniref:Uncharacterized protein n=1 Tax=Azospirillum himalayense TaxID=654847 RepID=A0ABW0GA66_9PROT
MLYDCHPELRRVLSSLGVDAVLQPVTLTVPEASREKAAHRLGAPEPGTLRVGIVWSGRVTFADNGRRATSLARFLRFAEVPGVRLYSLQKGPPESELADSGVAGSLVTPLGPDLDPRASQDRHMSR